MREFRSFGAFAEHLLVREAAVVAAWHEVLEPIGAAVAKTARAKIGEYQSAEGPFPAWEPLAESTVEDRIARGYAPDEPLLRTGELQDSISHAVEGLEAAVGSTSEIAVYQELGTERMPPRPFLGPAVYQHARQIVEALGAVTVNGLTGQRLIHDPIGYQGEFRESAIGLENEAATG
ncbi:MAG: HK97-gp10 family putative phage morphogenesis protein [Steroidobacteraceae bacterium]